MNNCSSFFNNCLFEKNVRRVKAEFVKGFELERSLGLIHSILGNIDITIHYLPWFPPKIIVSYEFAKGKMICLYEDSWEYSKGVDADSYEGYLDFYFAELEDDDRFKE
jgi:hypothetical protein